MPQIQLVPITEDNFRACIKLKVREDQHSYVAENAISIAQVYIQPTWEPRAIADGDTVVGFVLTGPDEEQDQSWIIRFMIGEEHQGKGYGKVALKAVIDHLRAQNSGRDIYLSYVPGNDVAERLYQSAGFEPTGEIDDGEIIMRLRSSHTSGGAAQNPQER